MGNKISLKDKPITYFKELHSCATIINDRQPKTKIQLGFTLEDCNISKSYTFQGFLFENNTKTLLGESQEETPNNKGTIYFQTTFVITYLFEAQQPFQIVITQGSGLTMEYDTTIGNIVGSKKSILKKKIPNNNETIVISANELKSTNKIYRMHFEMEHGVDCFDFKNKFYYVLWNNKNLYQSEVLSNEGKLNDLIIPLSLISPQFTLNFYNRKKKLTQSSIFNSDNFLTKEYAMIDVQLGKRTVKMHNKSTMNSQFSFMDYIKGGVHLSLTIGIDFTGSNGDPMKSTSLHYFGSQIPNNYEKAIRYCGDIIAYYDYDQMFPVYGFGAKLKTTKEVSMSFNINMQANPNIFTINNVLAEYKKIFQFVDLSGPTCFAPIIIQTINSIKEENNPFVYNILMILTDGMICDTNETINAIVAASVLPLSIIIVGIGNADFSAMNMLDGDDDKLQNSSGVYASRDIVQFVPFSQLENDPVKLAAEVLAEIPRQVVDFYRMINVQPIIPQPTMNN